MTNQNKYITESNILKPGNYTFLGMLTGQEVEKQMEGWKIGNRICNNIN